MRNFIKTALVCSAFMATGATAFAAECFMPRLDNECGSPIELELSKANGIEKTIFQSNGGAQQFYRICSSQDFTVSLGEGKPVDTMFTCIDAGSNKSISVTGVLPQNATEEDTVSVCYCKLK